jgi:hypothetical protein
VAIETLDERSGRGFNIGGHLWPARVRDQIFGDAAMQPLGRIGKFALAPGFQVEEAFVRLRRRRRKPLHGLAARDGKRNLDVIEPGYIQRHLFDPVDYVGCPAVSDSD